MSKGINNRAVSPVIGTVLLISITVILAGTIGFFVMNQNVPETTPNVALSVRDTNLYHNGGGVLSWENLEIKLSDGSFSKDSGNFTAGDVVDIGTSTGKITVIHKPTNSVLLRTDLLGG